VSGGRRRSVGVFPRSLLQLELARHTSRRGRDAFHLGKRSARRLPVVHDSVSDLVRLHVEMSATLTRHANFPRHAHSPDSASRLQLARRSMLSPICRLLEHGIPGRINPVRGLGGYGGESPFCKRSTSSLSNLPRRTTTRPTRPPQ